MFLPRLTRRALIGSGLAATATLSAGASLAQEAQAPRLTGDMVKGDPDAPVTVVEYASFTCPHCKTFHEQVFPRINEEFIETGKVRFILREVYFDRYGLWAGMLARCGGEDRYFGMVDMIFANQSSWPRGNDPAEVASNLFAMGRQAALTDAQMDACLQDGEWAQTLVEQYQTNASADDVTGTPSFVIDGEKYSNMGYSEFERVLNEKLGS
ncbi:MAG: DsbA family protein [Pseudomonadota bacterium]